MSVEYTITISDQMDADIQYLIDNQIPSPMLPPVFSGALTLSAVQDFLQSVVDRNIGFITSHVNGLRDQEMLAAIKSDNTVLDQVTTLVTTKRETLLKDKNPVVGVKEPGINTPVVTEPTGSLTEPTGSIP